jgi:hypothetical protein
MPVTYESAERAFRNANIEHTMADIMAAVEKDILPDETPIQAAARKSAERQAVARREAADSTESQRLQRKRERIKQDYPAVFN